MLTAMAGVAGFALLFGLVGLMPLAKGSCHGGECGGDACATCPFADGDGDGGGGRGGGAGPLASGR